ncbi:reverse transcriptase domain-containing protein [Tanacetum coccineum]
MSIRPSARRLLSPNEDPERLLSGRNHSETSLLFNLEEDDMAGQALPQGPIPDLRSIEELLQAPTDGVGDAIVGAARTWLEKEPPNSITTWNDLVSKFVNRFFPPSKTTNLGNEITRFQQRFGEIFAEAWDRFKDLLNKCPHHGFSPLHQIDTFYNSLNQSDQDSLNSTAGVLSASGSSTQDAAITALIKQVEALVSSMNRPINSIQNGCKTCGGPHAYYECQAVGGYTQEDVYATKVEPSVPLPHLSSSSKEVEQYPETITDQLPSPVFSPSEPSKRNPHQPPILYPSRLNKEKLQDKSDIQSINLLSDKKKLFGLADTSLTENYSPVLLKKLLEKLGDPGKFLIPYDFPELEKCMALADLGTSINLMPISVWKKMMLPKLVPTRKFTFLTDFIVVNYDIDPRIPLILGRPFLRMACALVDVYEEERILRDKDEKLIFHAESTARHPHKHVNESINMINFIDITCEDHFDEMLKIQKIIQCLSGSPTPSDLVVESLSQSAIPCGDSDSLVEETDTLLSYFNYSSPDYETFCFDIEEKSSGSTTSHFDHSLPYYKAFCFDDDHIEEKSSCSTTSHSLPDYESFHFDISIDPLPPADRSDSHHEEFANELAHIISSPGYDCFYFDIEPEPGELTILFEENISEDSTKEPTSLELNNLRLLLSDRDSIFSEEFSEIDLLVSFPSGNKDKIFDPRIFIIKGVQSKRFHILPLDDFSNISFVSNSLLLTDPPEIKTFLSFPSGNEDKVFDPGILIIDGIFSFTRKSPHLLSDNFILDKCHIFSEIYLMTESSDSL